MANDYVWKVEKGSDIKLKDYDPDYIHSHITHEETNGQLEKLGADISEMQELLAAAPQRSMIIILQGMDTSGRDGTIRHVFSRVNPQSCYVSSFKEPTQDELAHDFLWRVH